MNLASNSPGHEAALKLLADDVHVPREEVLQIYKSELIHLEAGARIHTFIPALALRRARERLIHKRRFSY